ncbi:MAG: CHAD domain-containing protein [Thermoguttaceae bacterium]
MDDGYRLLAAKYARKQAKQLRAQFAGICAAEDIEFVHRARVASRRLRAAMRIFGKCFKRKQVKRWKKAICRIRSELGDARDKDVQIELLRGILDSLTDKKCFAGISRLLVQWEYERERLQSNVVSAVKRLERNGTLQDLENAAKRLLLKAEECEIREQSPESFAQARQEILGLMNRLLALQDCLGRPDDQQSHHAMRIAAKRPRYTLEIIRPIYSGTLDTTLEVIKQVQTLLGEVHDCDVWQQELDVFGKKERDRIESFHGHAAAFARLNAGIEYLRQDRLRRRRQCFQDLVRLWSELDIQEFWKNLLGIFRSDVQQPETSKTTGPPETLETTGKQDNPAKSSGDANQVAADQAEAANQSSGDNNPEYPPALESSYVPQSG